MDTKLSPVGLEALNRAIGIVGLSRLARALGVPYQLVQGWRVEGRKYATPAEYVSGVVEAVREHGGEMRHEDLRPDIFQLTPVAGEREAAAMCAGSSRS